MFFATICAPLPSIMATAVKNKSKVNTKYKYKIQVNSLFTT